MRRAAATQNQDASELTTRSWRTLEEDMRQLGTPLLGRVMPIRKFRKRAESNPTTPKERKAIIEQAGLLINHLYPHLPFKRDVFSFIPKKDLFAKARAAIRSPSEIAFQEEMLDAFSVV